MKTNKSSVKEKSKLSHGVHLKSLLLLSCHSQSKRDLCRTQETDLMREAHLPNARVKTISRASPLQPPLSRMKTYQAHNVLTDGGLHFQLPVLVGFRSGGACADLDILATLRSTCDASLGGAVVLHTCKVEPYSGTEYSSGSTGSNKWLRFSDCGTTHPKPHFHGSVISASQNS